MAVQFKDSQDGPLNHFVAYLTTYNRGELKIRRSIGRLGKI